MQGTNICVVGDVLLDRSRTGTSSRVSPEDPECPIIDQPQLAENLGGAGNVAVWLARQPRCFVSLLGLAAVDEAGHRIWELCHQYGIAAGFPQYARGEAGQTTVKERTYLLDGDGTLRRQLVRCDWDSTADLNPYGLQFIQDRLADADLIVVADYGKGVFKGDYGQQLRQSIGTRYRNAVKVVNSKTPQDWEEYRLDALICNEKEAHAAWPGPFLDRIRAEYLVITRSEKGVSCFPRSRRKEPLCGQNYRSLVTQMVDPTGAGDAFAAGFALGLYEELTKEWKTGKNRELGSVILERILHGSSVWAACCCAQIGAGDPFLLARTEDQTGEWVERVEATGRR